MTPLIGTGIDDQPVEPRGEPLGVAQLRQLPPCLNERFLDRILRAVPVAQDQTRDREESVARTFREHLEGVVIAALCRFDEITLHVCLDGRATDAALTTYDARRSS